jgi:23S rRNA (cytosine1962-C5)-methyltransferase
MTRPAPNTASDLPAVTLKPHGEKRLGRGHPWVYSNEVEMDAAAKSVPAGGLVRLRATATAAIWRRPSSTATR